MFYPIINKNMFIPHIILFIAFYIIYMMLHKYDNNSFNDKNLTPIDLVYHTVSAHTTTGFCAVYPVSQLCKTLTTVHMALAFGLAISMFAYQFTEKST